MFASRFCNAKKIARKDTSKDADISTVGPCKEWIYENMVVATASVTDDACCFLADNVIGIVWTCGDCVFSTLPKCGGVANTSPSTCKALA